MGEKQLNIHTNPEMKDKFEEIKDEIQGRYFWMNVSSEDALGYLIALYEEFDTKPILEDE